MNEILEYINTHTRNKVVFHSEPIAGIKAHNIGILLSKSLQEIKDDNRFSLKASERINELLNSCKKHHTVFGEILSLENIGILLEPELKIDLNNLLGKFSNNNTLFIHWEGKIEKGCMYFLSMDEGKKIDITNLSHIII